MLKTLSNKYLLWNWSISFAEVLVFTITMKQVNLATCQKWSSFNLQALLISHMKHHHGAGYLKNAALFMAHLKLPRQAASAPASCICILMPKVPSASYVYLLVGWTIQESHPPCWFFTKPLWLKIQKLFQLPAALCCHESVFSDLQLPLHLPQWVLYIINVLVSICFSHPHGFRLWCPQSLSNLLTH